MIVTVLQGGLGNQLFQYAIGRALSLKLRRPLFLDKSKLGGGPQTTTHRDFELGAFLISASDFSERKPHLLQRLLESISSPMRVFEDPARFNAEVAGLKGDLILEGYWQDERYFKEITPVLRNEFRPKTLPPADAFSYLEKFPGTVPVSVHFRGGDYLHNPATNAFHGTCEPAYYARALEIVTQRVSEPHFLVFSDEPGWIEQHVAFPGPVSFIGSGDHRQQLHLMSLCSHHIIANSTFSWWGAWLNPSESKLVIAPERWFRNRENSIVPPSWIKV